MIAQTQHHRRTDAKRSDGSVAPKRARRVPGIAPTGRETEVRTHDFHEIADGRIVRTHHMEDWLSWFQQVGSWPSS